MSRSDGENSRLVNVRRAAEFLDISVWHLRRLIWRGDLPAVRLGRLVRVDRDDLTKYISEQKYLNGNPG
jgi:excisionase family DNA binding protein